MGYKQFTPDILQSTDVNEYLMNQAVMVFDSAAARDTALTAPTEGMIVYLKDTNQLLTHNGSSWVGLTTTTMTGSGPIKSTGTTDATGVHVGASAAPARFYSSAGDNFNIRTHTNTPNPNFSFGVSNGSGADSHVPIYWNNELVLRGTGTGNAGIRINSSQYVRMGFQPTFVVSGGKATAGPGFYPVEFGTVHYNDGNGYNTANGRFTCPADASGWYFLSAQVRLDGAGGNYIRGAIVKNGSTLYLAPNLHSINGNYHSTNYHSITVAGVMFLLAGDYVQYYNGSDAAVSTVQSESTFTGRYLG